MFALLGVCLIFFKWKCLTKTRHLKILGLYLDIIEHQLVCVCVTLVYSLQMRLDKVT